MNLQKLLPLLTTALLLRFGVPATQAAGSISVDFFYDQLGDYGDWVEVGDYGYGWQPRGVDPDWRPYSDGRWAYTDAGWTWLSDEPYGWAVYHYGRWARLEDRGWVWIPGTEWAPAWVSWRRSPKHVGWAPLPPEASFRHGVGLSAWVDSYYDIGPSAYRFVEVRNFGAPRLRTVFVEPRENITIIRQTTNITRITYVNSVVNNGGPRYEEISRESAEPVSRLKLDRRVEIEGDRANFRGEQMRSRVEGDALHVFAPGFDARPVEAPRKLAGKIEKVEINRGWKDAGPAAEVEKLHAKVRAEAKPPRELPPQPKFEKLSGPATASEAQPAPAAAGEKPPMNEPKEPRKSAAPLPVPPTPPTPLAEAKPKAAPAPTEKPAVPDAPVKPSTTGKPASPEATPTPETRPKKEGKGAKATPPPDEPAKPQSKGKNRPPSDAPAPTPVDPVEPKMKTPHQDAPRKLPPPPEHPAPKDDNSLPPEPTQHRDTPKPPKDEPHEPKIQRPEVSRELPPAVEKSKPKPDRPSPPAVIPGNAPQPPTRGEAPVQKEGKGKSKGEKKPSDEEPKPQ